MIWGAVMLRMGLRTTSGCISLFFLISAILLVSLLRLPDRAGVYPAAVALIGELRLQFL